MLGSFFRRKQFQNMYTVVRRTFSSDDFMDPYFTSKKFTELDIKPNLKQALQNQGYKYLTEIQALSMDAILKGKNSLLLSETGSGKTLCYVVPIINQIYKRLAQPENKNPMRGALILAPTKELCSQIYATFRKLDQEHIIRITRTGSIMHIAPVVHLLDQRIDPDQLREISQQNMVNALTWSEWDVVVSTPVKLDNLFSMKDKKDPYDVNPKTVVLDEYDLLLGEENIAKATTNILRRFAGVHKSHFGETNKERQFILCGATSPRKVGGINIQDEVKNWFVDLQVFKSEDFHKFSERIDCESVDVPDGILPEKEVAMLAKVIQSSTANKIIVFCNSMQRVQLVHEYLTRKGEMCLPYFASMPEEERMNVLSKFNSPEFNYRILAATDLASRGIDFVGVEHVIQFDFGTNITAIMHRAGRTARIGKKGRFTSFIRPKDELLYSRFQEILKGKLDIEAVFSHKRSLNKKEKKIAQRKEAEEEEESEI